MFCSHWLEAPFRAVPQNSALHITDLLNSLVNKRTSREISDSTFSLSLECGVWGAEVRGKAPFHNLIAVVCYVMFTLTL